MVSGTATSYGEKDLIVAIFVWLDFQTGVVLKSDETNMIVVDTYADGGFSVWKYPHRDPSRLHEGGADLALQLDNEYTHAHIFMMNLPMVKIEGTPL